MLKKQFYGVLFGFILTIAINAQQNYKFENFGDKSMLLNGNVTGSVSDLGATFYNPSRLTTIKEPLFSINGKIYQLNTIKLKNYVKSENELKNKDFISLPRMVAGTFKVKFLPKSYLAYSLLTRQNSDLSIFYEKALQVGDAIPSQEGDETYSSQLTIGNKVKEEWYGASWATKLSERFNIGVSLYFSQYSSKGNNEQGYATVSENKENVSAYNNVIRFEQDSYGLFSKVGISYTHSKIELGLNVDVPYLEIYSEGSIYQNETLTGLGDFDDRFSYNNFKDLKAKRKYPLGIQFGAGIKVKKSMLHLNMSWNANQKTYDKLVIPELVGVTNELPQLYFKEELRNVVNYGFGLELYLTKRINGFASYSSDFSPFRKNATIFDLFNQETEDVNMPINFHHVGLGSNFTIKNIDIALGGTFSTGQSSFMSPLNLPSVVQEAPLEDITIRQSRWRVIVGINISIIKDSLKK